MYTTYIINSENIDKFYVGSSSDALKERLRRHNSNHSGFTGKVNDWVVIFSTIFSSVYEARALEKKIKNEGQNDSFRKSHSKY
jgi:putative endonuclease